MKAINYIYNNATYMHESIVANNQYVTVIVKIIKVGSEWIAIDSDLNLYAKGATKKELQSNIVEILRDNKG